MIYVNFLANFGLKGSKNVILYKVLKPYGPVCILVKMVTLRPWSGPDFYFKVFPFDRLTVEITTCKLAVTEECRAFFTDFL